MAHNGKVIVHRKVLIAHDLMSAQSLAARIVNEALDEHDQRTQAAHEAARQDGGTGEDRGTASPGDSERGAGRSEAVPRQSQRNAGRSRNLRIQDSDDAGTPEQASPLGSVDPASGRIITHSTDDLDEAQGITTAAAPELEDTLQQVADSVPGVEADGVRLLPSNRMNLVSRWILPLRLCLAPE